LASLRWETQEERKKEHIRIYRNAAVFAGQKRLFISLDYFF